MLVNKEAQDYLVAASSTKTVQIKFGQSIEIKNFWNKVFKFVIRP
jgi:hypothetical protein